MSVVGIFLLVAEHVAGGLEFGEETRKGIRRLIPDEVFWLVLVRSKIRGLVWRLWFVLRPILQPRNLAVEEREEKMFQSLKWCTEVFCCWH
jgi:hypothetical protein